MDYHPIQGGIEILLVIQCYRNRDKLGDRMRHFARGFTLLPGSVLDSRSSGLGLCPGWGHFVLFLGKTLYSHSASLHPCV